MLDPRKREPRRTICEVHRDIWRAAAARGDVATMRFAEEAYGMAKRMDARLRRYKAGWDADEWAPGLTVACLLWGSWPHGETYVRRLESAVARNLRLPHRFVCLSDRQIEGIACLPLATACWPRNLPKMALHAPGNGLRGRVLAFDLDDIPVGPLDGMAMREERFVCVEDPWDRGKAGGGTCLFTAGDPILSGRLYRPCVEDMAEVLSISGGSERHWLRHACPDAAFWSSGEVVDAKPRDPVRVIDDLPRGAAVAHFHGRPRPHEVDRAWLHEHWREQERS